MVKKVDKKKAQVKTKYFKSDLVMSADSKSIAEKHAEKIEKNHDVLVGQPVSISGKKLSNLVSSKKMRRITPKTPKLI